MLRWIALIVMLALAGAAGAQQRAYKWTDEKGGVHYGEKPPPNVRATPVDTQPYGVEAGDAQCHTIACQGEKLEADRRSQAARDAADARVEARTQAQPPAARGMDFNVFIRLQAGMSEGELLLRAGPPDYEAFDNSRYGGVKKSLYYYPTTSNPYTTIVTVRAGRIANLERVKKF